MHELQPQAVLALEGHGLDEVVVDHVGSIRATVTVDGPGGHSWHDRGTPSATHAVARLATEILGPGVNIGTIAGGRSVNAIADHAEMLVERRSLDEAELDAFEAGLDRLNVEPPLRSTRTIVAAVQPVAHSATIRWWRRCARCAHGSACPTS